MNDSSFDVFLGRWPLKTELNCMRLTVVQGQERGCSLGWRCQVSPRVGALSTLLASVALVHAQQSLPPKPLQLPTLTTVSQGKVSISQTQQANAAQMSIIQSTPSAVINWSSFDVGSNAQVNFIQPNANSSVLNRISDVNPSQIYGQIKSNGQVFLSNPNGFYFSPTASVEVGAFTASTHGLSDDDFLAGRWTLARNGAKGSIVNEGSISSALGSYVALLAPEVRNAGVVLAKVGTVVMASGEAITLNVEGTSSLAGITTTPSTIATLISNQQAVSAPGGQILLSASALNQLQAGVINNSGTLEANSITTLGGKIILEASDIHLQRGSLISATSPVGGGSVWVGSPDQASHLAPHSATTQTNQPQAPVSRIVMDAGALVDVSATDRGNGGKVVLLSDLQNPSSVTSVQGVIKAQGGPHGGNGGQIETSGSKLILTDAQVSTWAPQGETGTWLLDPSNVTIGTGDDLAYLNNNSTLTPTTGDNITTINVNTLQNLLTQNNITITTTNDQTPGVSLGTITVAAPISISSGKALTLNSADQVINTGSTVTLSNGSSLNINAGATSVWSGVITGAGNVGVSMPGKSLSMTGNNSYTGTTTIGANSTLVLSGSASLMPNTTLINAGTLSLTNKSNINALDLQTWLGAGAVTVTAPSNLNVTVSNSATQAASSFTGTGNITISSPIVYTSNLLNLSASANIYINQPIAANFSLANNAIADAAKVAQLQLGYGGSSTYYVNAPVYLGNSGSNFFTLNSGSKTTWVVINDLGARADATTAPALMTLQGLTANFSVASPSQKNYVLGSNIDATSTSTWSGDIFNFITGFVPIGYYKPGSFQSLASAIRLDGLGHNVSNLSIVTGTGANLTPNTVLADVGFVSVLGSSGLIRNFGLINETLQFNGGTVSSNKFSVGGLFGTSQASTTVSNVNVSGQISGRLTYQIGGVAGSSASTITNSSSTASVTLTSVGAYNPAATAAAGGLVGRNATTSNGTLSYDYASGNVVAPAGAAIGSLVGDVGTSNVSNSYASGQVSTNAGVSFVTPATIAGAGAATQSSQLTSAQALVQANFVNWDFANAWMIGPSGPMSTYAPSLLVVEPTVNAVNYGSSFPAVSYALVGLTGPDNVGNVTFTPGAISTSYAANNNAGRYVYSISGNVTGQTNVYKVVLDSGSLTVNKQPIYVLPSAGQSSVYGTTPAVTYAFNTNANGGAGSVVATNSASLTGLAGNAVFNNTPTSASNVGNYSLSYGSGLSSTNYTFNAGNAGVNYAINAASVTLGGSKTYDGSAVFAAGNLSVAGVNGQTLTLVSGTATANSKDVGASTAWASTNALVLGNGTGLASNYTLTNLAASAINISRLNSVTWTGGATGNWFDPGNWAGGAVPDLSYVSNVVIGANATVSFGSAVVAPAQVGAVNINGLTGSGRLSMSAGNLNVGTTGVSLTQFTQSGGTLTDAGNWTVTNGFTQGSTGSLSVAGVTSVSASASAVTLGNLSSTGALSVTSSAGAVGQAVNTVLNAVSGLNVSASSGAQAAPINITNSGNTLQGSVSLNGSSVALVNAQALSLAAVSATADLSLQSAGAMSLGLTTVAGGLTLVSGGGNITQTAAISVAGNASLNAALGSINLPNSGNVFKGSVSTVASSVTIVGLPVAPSNNDAPAPVVDPPLNDTDLVQMTPAQLILASAQQIAQITPAQIGLISPVCIAALTPAQVIYLNSAQIKAFSNAQVAALTPLQIASMSYFQITYINDAQFGFLQPASVAAFTAQTIKALSVAEIRNLSVQDVQSWSAAQLALLSSTQWQSLSTSQLAALSPTQVSLLSLQQWRGLSAAQWQALSVNTLASLSSQVWASLSPNVIQGLSAQVFGLLTAVQLNALGYSQLQVLTAQQLASVSPLEFPAINPSQLSALSLNQLSALSALQVSAITASQMKALSFSQFTAIATPLVKRYMTANVPAADILNYFLANPSVSDAQVVTAMDQFGVSPQQVANALSVPLSVVQVRYEASAGSVYANLKGPIAPSFPTYWGLGLNYTATQVVNGALGLQANGATFLDIASDMYTLGVTPSQFRNAFLGINIAQ